MTEYKIKDFEVEPDGTFKKMNGIHSPFIFHERMQKAIDDIVKQNGKFISATFTNGWDPTDICGNKDSDYGDLDVKFEIPIDNKTVSIKANWHGECEMGNFNWYKGPTFNPPVFHWKGAWNYLKNAFEKAAENKDIELMDYLRENTKISNKILYKKLVDTIKENSQTTKTTNRKRKKRKKCGNVGSDVTI